MGTGFFSDNTTQKIASKTSATLTGNGALLNTTSIQYAKVHIAASSTATADLTLGGVVVGRVTASSTVLTFHVGPSDTLAVANFAGSGNITMGGVIFENTP